MQVININEKFTLFKEHWKPKVIAELNGQEVKLAKVKGEFVWHDHKDEDELFYVIKGKLHIAFEDKTVEINEGEMIIVPKGTKHKPIAEEEVLLLLFEPKSTKHTGDVIHDLTAIRQDKI